jgi:hypothetical protein
MMFKVQGKTPHPPRWSIIPGMEESLAEVTTLVVPSAPSVHDSSGLRGGLDAQQLLEVVTALLEHADRDGPMEVVHRLLDAAVDLVPGAHWASVTMVRGGALRTLTSSHPEAERADAIQYDLGTGPCVDAAVDDSVFVTAAVHQDRRWPEYGRRVHQEVGVCSVMAHRLTLLDDSDIVAALNIYSRHADAFDDDAVRQGTLLAAQCSLLVSAHLAVDRSDNLVRALGSNREIGMAMGVLMARHHVTRDEAFAMLRHTSQDSNRKVADVAARVVDTGELPTRQDRRLDSQPALGVSPGAASHAPGKSSP